jgi:hypothetical protein
MTDNSSFDILQKNPSFSSLLRLGPSHLKSNHALPVIVPGRHRLSPTVPRHRCRTVPCGGRGPSAAWLPGLVGQRGASVLQLNTAALGC